MRLVVGLSLSLLLPTVCAAQSPASIRGGVNSITPEDIARRIGVIAHDSMRGRDTPSPELEEVAAWIASEFRSFGLKPGGDDGSYLQRYPLDYVRVAPARSVAFLRGAGDEITLAYSQDFVFTDNAFAPGDHTGELVLLSGSLAAGAPDTAALAGKMLVLATPLRNRGERARLNAWRPAGIVLISGLPDSVWARVTVRAALPQLRDPTRPVGGPVPLGVREATVRTILARLGTSLDSARQAPPGPMRARAFPRAQLHVHAALQTVERQSAPNVIAILEGSDPQLKREYVVYSAHMDHVGVGRPVAAAGGDSIYNGADDDASGTIAVVEAAEAFAQLTPRPKRSILFLTVSGEEHGLWGSGYFADHPTVPLAEVVANLNLDMVGRNWKDTISVIGKEHSDLGATLNRVGAAHPELNMQPVDDLWPQENFYFRSDHYNFARKGVPILFFFNGTHADYHQVTDHPEKIDAEKESRIVKLVFYLGLEVANAAQRPRWNPDSYKQIVHTTN